MTYNNNTDAQTADRTVIVDEHTECNVLWTFIRIVSDNLLALTRLNRETVDRLIDSLKKNEGGTEGAPDWEVCFSDAMGACDTLSKGIREFGLEYVSALGMVKGFLWGPAGEEQESE